jgi:hypothetical protein
MKAGITAEKKDTSFGLNVGTIISDATYSLCFLDKQRSFSQPQYCCHKIEIMSPMLNLLDYSHIKRPSGLASVRPYVQTPIPPK